MTVSQRVRVAQRRGANPRSATEHVAVDTNTLELPVIRTKREREKKLQNLATVVLCASLLVIAFAVFGWLT